MPETPTTEPAASAFMDCSASAINAAMGVPADQIPDAIPWAECYLETLKGRALTLSTGDKREPLSGKTIGIARGLVDALASLTFATPGLIAKSLIGVLWTADEASQILP